MNQSQMANKIRELELRIERLERETGSTNAFGAGSIYSVKPIIGCPCPVGAEKTCKNPMCGRSGKQL